MGKGRRRFAVTVAVALAVVAAACSTGTSNSARPPASTTTSAPATTTTTVDPTKAAILAAYRAHWNDVIVITSKYPMNPLDPELSLHTTGKQLISEQQAISQLNLKALYEVGTLDLNPVITSVSGDVATIMDCDFDHFVDTDAHTGQPVAKPDVGHTLLTFSMAKINGVWLVSDSTIVKSGKTTDACVPSAS